MDSSSIRVYQDRNHGFTAHYRLRFAAAGNPIRYTIQSDRHGMNISEACEGSEALAFPCPYPIFYISFREVDIWLDIYATGVLLEAARDDIKIVPSGIEAQIPHVQHHGIRVVKSSSNFRSTIQLRHNDRFLVNNFTFQLEYQQNSLLIQSANIVDLEVNTDLETDDKSARESKINNEAPATEKLSQTPRPSRHDSYVISETPVRRRRTWDVRGNDIDLVSTVANEALKSSQGSLPRSQHTMKHKVMTAIRKVGAEQEGVARSDPQESTSARLDEDVTLEKQDFHVVLDKLYPLKSLQDSPMPATVPDTFAAIGGADTAGKDTEFLVPAVQLVTSDIQASYLPTIEGSLKSDYPTKEHEEREKCTDDGRTQWIETSSVQDMVYDRPQVSIPENSGLTTHELSNCRSTLLQNKEVDAMENTTIASRFLHTIQPTFASEDT